MRGARRGHRGSGCRFKVELSALGGSTGLLTVPFNGVGAARMIFDQLFQF